MTERLRRPRSGWGGAAAAVACSVGLLIGTRAALRLELPRPRALLGVAPLPREGLGLGWSRHAVWPADLQAAALDRLVALLAALALGAIAIAALNALVLLVEAAASRRGELAVRAALGASRRTLASMMLHELRRAAAVALSLGVVLGLSAGGLARLAWPGPAESVSFLPAFAQVAPAVALLVVILAAAYVRSGLRAARPERAASILRAGARTADDPAAIFARKALGAVHLTLVGGVVVGAATLAGAVGSLTGVGSAPRAGGSPTAPGAPVAASAQDARTSAPASQASRTVVVEAVAPGAGRWGEALEALSSVPGLAAESLATPGALVGLGVRDFALAECGRCSRGLMPAPLWTSVVHHHAVTPGFLELADLALVDGRPLLPSDGPEAEPVVLVSRSFAYSSFENGDPVGKRVRLGTGFHDWYRVVGVVEDLRVPVLGANDRAPEAVYMSALQAPPRRGTILLRGSPAAIEEARARLGRLGFSPGPALTLADHRLTMGAPLVWARTAAAFLALAALLLGAHGVYVAALQTARRRAPAIAVRRAVGAGTRHVLAHVAGERARVAGWGLAGMLLVGTMVVGLLRKAAGMAALPPSSYGAVAALLVVVAAAASLRAARESLAVEPVRVLE